MQAFLSLLRSRALSLSGLVALGLAQTACAHPVWVEPSVVVHARVGGPVHGTVYGTVYGPAPVVVAPPAIWMPPSVVVPARVYMPAPAPIYRYGHRSEHRGHGHKHGHTQQHWR
jgi:hypothetical protein